MQTLQQSFYSPEFNPSILHIVESEGQRMNKCSRKYDPGWSSRNRILIFNHPGTRIQGTKRHRIPDTQHEFYNKDNHIMVPATKQASSASNAAWGMGLIPTFPSIDAPIVTESRTAAFENHTHDPDPFQRNHSGVAVCSSSAIAAAVFLVPLAGASLSRDLCRAGAFPHPHVHSTAVSCHQQQDCLRPGWHCLWWRVVVGSVADPGCFSRIRIFSILDPGSAFKCFNPKNCF